MMWAIIGALVAILAVLSACGDRRRNREDREWAHMVMASAPRFLDEDGNEVIDLTGVTHLTPPRTWAERWF